MKRCPRCGRGYEEYWKVCLEDGEPLIEVKTIHKSPEAGIFKSLSWREAEEEKRGILVFFLIVGAVAVVFICWVVAKFSGNPFMLMRDAGAIKVFDTLLYNAGALTGMFVTALILTFPLWFFWWRKK